MTSKDQFRTPKRFYSFDIIRGIAALSVVIWHWQHFYYQDQINHTFDIDKQPFYSFLFLFYENGGSAVNLFFVLSGFIFYWLYSEKIISKNIHWRKFAILRLSRLYPLHFITLISTLLLQLLYKFQNDNYFIYGFNDLYHFILQIFFISNWGFENGFSYNGPIWSVSIEIFLYIVFFILSQRRVTKSISYTIIIILFALFLERLLQIKIFSGIHFFFTGGLVYLLYLKLLTKHHKYITTYMALASTILWLFPTLYHNPLINLKESIFIEIFPNKLWDILCNNYESILFPITLMSLALLETRYRSIGKSLRSIGDITYSSYLLHFPLQLILVLGINHLGINSRIYNSDLLFIAFMSVLIILSYLVFQKIEKPIQDWLRNIFIKKK